MNATAWLLSVLAHAAPLPPTLAETGLYDAEGAIAADALPFAPQYPLWTDGATKRRWIRLPPGTAIDATDPDAWVFPIGTQLWKEFSFGEPIETRYMERAADGTWLLGTYVWRDGDAVLASRGTLVDVGGGQRHEVPSPGDCAVCHDARPILGFSALQLSTARDPLAPHGGPPPDGAVDLAGLVAAGLVVGIADTAPVIDAPTPTERAARGYLHGNCGGCHDPQGALAIVGLDLHQSIAGDDLGALLTTIGQPSHAALPSDPSAPRVRIVPGAPDASVLLGRVASRSPTHQMPPLGTRVVDDEAVALITAWITELEPDPSSRRKP